MTGLERLGLTLGQNSHFLLSRSVLISEYMSRERTHPMNTDLHDRDTTATGYALSPALPTVKRYEGSTAATTNTKRRMDQQTRGECSLTETKKCLTFIDKFRPRRDVWLVTESFFYSNRGRWWSYRGSSAIQEGA
jgi:hypothetical protein